MRRLPLDPLRTFELAGRHESFARAARDLHLTDSAVSHQLKRLEAAVGFPLFERRGRRVALTDAGRLFHRTVRESLEAMSQTASLLAEQVGELGGPLVIGAPPMFASKWLAPRLADFASDHPSVQCAVQVIDNERVAEAPQIDVGVTFGGGSWAGRWAVRLAEIQLTPTCSPRLFGDRGGVIPDVAALGAVPLLHQDDGTEWHRWLEAAGARPALRHYRNLYFTDISVAIDVALHGGGMVLASDVLTSQYVREGSLMRPFPMSIDAAGGWYALGDPRRLQLPSVRSFVSWLTASFGAASPFDVGEFANSKPGP